MPMSDIPEFVKFARPIPMIRNGRKANYRSWIELYLFEWGVLRNAEYEPQRISYERISKYEQTTQGFVRKIQPRNSIYQPDTISKKNPNVFFEIKGHLTTKDDDRGEKYLSFCEQNPDKTIIFVLQQRNILLPWTITNGEILDQGLSGDYLEGESMEEWCNKHGFPFTYYFELDEYFQSHEYAEIVGY